MLPFRWSSDFASWLIVAGCCPSANSSRCRRGCPSALYCAASETSRCSSTRQVSISLDASSTRCFPASMRQNEISAVVQQVVGLLAEHYVFPDVGVQVGAALTAALAADRYPDGVAPAELAE